MPLVPVNAGGVAETSLAGTYRGGKGHAEALRAARSGAQPPLTLSREDLKREDGQGAVEYALVVLGIAAVISLAVAGFATQITNFMSAAGAALIALVP
jgi:hypothetical protein